MGKGALFDLREWPCGAGGTAGWVGRHTGFEELGVPRPRSFLKRQPSPSMEPLAAALIPATCGAADLNQVVGLTATGLEVNAMKRFFGLIAQMNFCLKPCLRHYESRLEKAASASGLTQKAWRTGQIRDRSPAASA